MGTPFDFETKGQEVIDTGYHWYLIRRRFIGRLNVPVTTEL